jgi:dihydrofolate reductase
MIWAEAKDRVIGAGGGIPWRIPGEQATFRERTMGSTVVMGRLTWESLPQRARPLPGRRNVVLTRDPDWSAEGATVAHAVHAVDLSDDVWVMGGAAVYSAFLPLTAHVVRTTVDVEVPGDVRAPALGDDWLVTQSSGWQTSANGIRYRIDDLVRAGR